MSTKVRSTFELGRSDDQNEDSWKAIPGREFKEKKPTYYQGNDFLAHAYVKNKKSKEKEKRNQASLGA